VRHSRGAASLRAQLPLRAAADRQSSVCAAKRAATAQNEAANGSAIEQDGDNLAASVQQNGDANSAAIRQFGRNTTGSITQNG